MAWPRDARLFDFSAPPAREIVSSAFLNGLQDAIMALYVNRNAYVVAASTAPAATKLVARYVCDGVADEVEINAAIAEAAAAGGGVVLLSEGTFTIASGIVLDNYVTLMGAGINATTIRIVAAPGQSVDMISATALYQTRVSSLALDANKALMGAYYSRGINFDSERGVIDRIQVVDTNFDTLGGEGIRVLSDYVDIAFCTADGCERGGFVFETGADHGELVACKSIGCVCAPGTLLGGVVNNAHHFTVLGHRSAGDTVGIALLAGNYAQVKGCRAVESLDSGINIFSLGALVQGNHVVLAQGDGIYLAGESCMVCDNEVHASGQSSDDTCAGIYCYDGLNSVVRNNLCRHGGGAVKPKAGVECAAAPNAPSGLLVYGNDLRGSAKTGGNEIVDPSGCILTCPEWCGTGAGTNAQNNAAAANRI